MIPPPKKKRIAGEGETTKVWNQRKPPTPDMKVDICLTPMMPLL